ncbi:MAG: ChaN family lipoprotein [Betaproteobacteria bacterium]|nr:ChaN family lipoprotein [Betaproteobacteria bacterium]
MIKKLSLRQWMVMSPLGLTLLIPITHAQIIDLHSGQEISERMLVDRLRAQDIVLLGELHDNAQHHALRAQLIQHIAGDQLTVIAEHLPSGARVKREGPLLADLEAAGFDAKGWQWPLHSPLFDAVSGAKLPLIGGNLPKGFSKQLFWQGESALPTAMARAYKTASLSADASRQLDQDLINGHCGKLPEKYLQPMRLVQRATDLSMAQALLDHVPSVLVAGNGHVRKDYGVPQVLGAIAPALKITAVGFYEADSPREELVKSLAGRYDIVWLSKPAERADPCENFKIK